MDDGGIEAQSGGKAVSASLVLHSGEYDERVHAALAQAERAGIIERIWKKDASLWKAEESHQKIIANSLGWLAVPGKMLEAVSELTSFAQTIRASSEFEHVMVCGMGGSSLCPEVLRQTFGHQPDSPALLVLDSTDPDVIDHFRQQIKVNGCLFIISSKSGTTTEPIAFHRYWYSEVAQTNDSPGNSFVAITDPGTHMESLARSEGFKRVFLNQSDIGGRYSALSCFGMVPAALMGLDVTEILRRADAMGNSCQAPASQNSAARLGAVMSECAIAGRDKLTLITDGKLSSFGLWVEQLIAESTGKEGKGIVPVVGEPLGPVSAYGNDRLFISIAVGTVDQETDRRLSDLEATGHPVIRRQLADLYDLGAEFFLWEMATAFAGWRLAINPFDQPNVQESKDATRALLEKYSQEGKLPEQSPIATDGTLTIFTGSGDAPSVTQRPGSVSEALRQHFAEIKRGDYVALLAYVEETPETDSALQAIRIRLRDTTGCATTLGYGPRYLHSTGQLHKGGPNSGVFIQLTAPDKSDYPIPGAPYTFSILKQAQAQGDFEALLAHGRRAIRVDLGENVQAGLSRLSKLILSKA